jgi:lipoprotein-releasing system permease protein
VEGRVSILPSRMIAGRFDALEAGAFRVVIGARLARRLAVSVGDSVTLVMPDPRVTLAGAFPRQKRLEVAGIFELRTDVDDIGVYVHLDDAQRLLRVSGEAAALRLRLADLFAAEAVVRALLMADPEDPLRAYDWRRTHGNLYEAIGLQKRIMFVLLSLLVAVAAFNVVAMLTMVVRNRRGDIAILRTMGMTPRSLVRIFFTQGALIALVGIGVGLLAGSALAALLPELVAGLQRVLGRDLLAEYFVRELPVSIRVTDLVLVACVALVLALLTTWWPARRALAIAPAEELRHE